MQHTQTTCSTLNQDSDVIMDTLPDELITEIDSNVTMVSINSNEITVEDSSTVVDLDNGPQQAVHYIVGRANEDRSNLCLLNGQITMYAVYDGHSGHQTSTYLKENFPKKLAQCLFNVDFQNESQVKEKITDAFTQFDLEMKNQIQNHWSGSTAIIALLSDSRIYLAHVGDSRALVVDQNGHLLIETIDHDGHNEAEVTRITNLGGFVSQGIVPRVSGQLAVTRAFGDYGFSYKANSKNNYLPDWYVSVIPEIDVFNRDNHQKVFLLLASDGLWNGKYKESNNVIQMIADTKTEDSLFSVNFKHRIQGDLSQLCQEITQKGYDNYSGWKDDITVIISLI